MRVWPRRDRQADTRPGNRTAEGEADRRLAQVRMMRAPASAEALVGKWVISFQQKGGPAYRAGQVLGRAADTIYLIRYESAVAHSSQHLVAAGEMERQGWEFFDSRDEMMTAWAHYRQRGLKVVRAGQQ